MTSITRNLPWFIRDLGVSIIGQKCYTSLIENLDLGDIECIKYSISKGLGIGIVVGGSIMKVPQLLLIVNARSARGLSLTSYLLETLAYGITLTYSYRNEFPFSTYGENFFLTIQNVIITLLMILYAPTRLRQKNNKTGNLLITALGIAGTCFALYTVPKDILQLLQLSTLPLSLFSKLPQIRQNYRSQSTGQLSAFAVISQIAGCAARLFTVAQEVGDSIFAAGFALALALNVVLGIQLYIYWGKDVEGKHAQRDIPLEIMEKDRLYTPVQAPQPIPASPAATTAIHHRVATPPPQGNRKWARKVD